MADSDETAFPVSNISFEIPTASVGLTLTYEETTPQPGEIGSSGGETANPPVFGPITWDGEQPLGTFSLAQTIAGITFDENGANNSGSYFIPPDPSAAAGPNHLVSVVNTSVEFHAKDGTQTFSTSLKSFFGSATSTFDPKVVYDQYNGRFVIVTLERSNLGNGNSADDESRILVAVSDDSDPNGTWYQYTINSLTTISSVNAWADYPGLAVDDQAIYITNNMFEAEGVGGFLGERLWIIPKGDGSGGLYDGGAGSNAIYDPATASGGIATTMMPTMMYGAAPGSTGAFLVSYSGLSDGINEYIQVIRVDDPLGTPSFTQQFVNLGDIENTSLSMPDAPQSGTATAIETNDRRLYDTVWRDNSLYAVTTIVGSGADSGDATVYWAEIDTTNLASLALAQSGTIGGEDIAADTFTFFPSVAVNADGDVGIGFAASAPTIFGGAYFTWRDVGDAAGTTRGSITVQAGLDSYVRTFGGARNRWGDYTATFVDPADDSTFWTFNEYADTSGTIISGENGRWATVFGRFAEPTDTNPFDFDGDGGDDVLTQRISDGLVQALDGTGGLQQGYGPEPVGGIEAIADFNGDGVQDILVRLANDSLRSYSGADNSQIANYGIFSTYTLLATADMDGDGGTDLLLQRNDGLLQAYDGDGGFQQGYGPRGIGNIIGVGDVNGDGADDILVRYPNDSLRAFSGTDNSQITIYGNFATRTLLDLGDFDGDGGLDLLTQRNDGLVQVFNGEGGFQQGFGAKPIGGVEAVGDINGDNIDDIAFRFATDLVRAYSGADNSQIANYGVLSGRTILALKDFDGDGDDDLLVQRTSDGLLQVLNTSGGVQQGFGPEPVGGLELVGDFNGDGSDDILVRYANDNVRGYSGADNSQIANHGILGGIDIIGGLPPLLDIGFSGVL